MAKPILHTKFHQNRTIGFQSAPALYIVESKGSDPFKLFLQYGGYAGQKGADL